MSRWHQQLVRRHRAAHVRREEAWQRWLLLSGDPGAVAWHEAEPWQRLASEGRLRPGADCSLTLPVFEQPWALIGIRVLTPSPEATELNLLLNGHLLVVDRARVAAGQRTALRPLLVLPGNILQARIINTSKQAAPFRAVLLAYSVNPGGLLAQLLLAAQSMPVARGHRLFPAGMH